MRKVMVGSVVFAVLAGVVLFFIILHPSKRVTVTATDLDQNQTQNQIQQDKAAEAVREPGTVAFWDAMDTGEEDKWMDSEHEFMRTVVGEVGETTERWLGSVAPDLVYVEASKCQGSLRPSESETCEVRLSKKIEKIFNKCGNSRPSDVRSCIVSMDPEVAGEEKRSGQR